MDWLEVSLSVDGELAEAVAEVLARYCQNGVAMEQGVRQLDDDDVGSAAGLVTVRAYLKADERLDENLQRIEEALHYLGMIQPLPAPMFRSVAEQNWMEAWRKHYRPIPIGQRLMVLPAWLEPTDSRRIAIKIDPGMAFGTGTHPSTRLCLEFIDTLLNPTPRRTAKPAPRPVTTVIDVGCGSGILSIAAVKLGSMRALGVDIDPKAVSDAHENAVANGIGSELVLGVGSVKEILDGRFALKMASLVVVNILAHEIIRLLGEGLAGLLEPGGLMILAGILEAQASEVELASQRAGLVGRDRRQLGEWVALAMEHRPASPSASAS